MSSTNNLGSVLIKLQIKLLNKTYTQTVMYDNPKSRSTFCAFYYIIYVSRSSTFSRRFASRQVLSNSRARRYPLSIRDPAVSILLIGATKTVPDINFFQKNGLFIRIEDSFVKVIKKFTKERRIHKCIGYINEFIELTFIKMNF